VREPFEVNDQVLRCLVDLHLFLGVDMLFTLITVPLIVSRKSLIKSEVLQTVIEIDFTSRLSFKIFQLGRHRGKLLDNRLLVEIVEISLGPISTPQNSDLQLSRVNNLANNVLHVLSVIKIEVTVTFMGGVTEFTLISGLTIEQAGVSVGVVVDLKFVQRVLHFLISIFRPVLLKEVFIFCLKYVLRCPLVFGNFVQDRLWDKDDRSH